MEFFLPNNLLSSFITILETVWSTRLSSYSQLEPIAVGILLQLFFILTIACIWHFFPRSSFSLLITTMMEKMYDFFAEILGPKSNTKTKLYILTLFCIILIANLSNLLIDLIRITFVDIENIYTYIQIPTANF